MNWIEEWLYYFWGVIRGWFKAPYRTVIREGSLPRRLAPQAVYILFEDGDPWQASMICPCGCKSVLEMNLLPDDHPVWKADVRPNIPATLHPSVWRKIGCESHFFIRDGRIIWC